MALLSVTLQDIETWKSKKKTGKLVSALTYPGHNTRKAAVDALESIGWAPSTDEETVLLHIGKNEFSECLQYGETAIGPLIDVSSDEKYGEEAGKALAQLGDPALEKLTETFRDTGRSVMKESDENRSTFLFQRTIAYGVHHLQFGEKGKEKLLILLNAERGMSDISAVHERDKTAASPVVKLAIAEILSREGDRRVLPFIKETLTAKTGVSDFLVGTAEAITLNPQKRAAKRTLLLLSALRALGNLGDPAYFDLAFKIHDKLIIKSAGLDLDGMSATIKEWEKSIAPLIAPENGERILELYKAKHSKIEPIFKKALIDLGPAIEDKMIAALDRPEEGVRTAAVTVLAGIGSEKVVRTFIEKIEKVEPKEKVPHDFWEAAWALEKMDDPEAQKAAKEFLAKAKGKCFVATAVYGDYDAPEVRVLRAFRDRELLPRTGGRLFVSFYYSTAPHFIGLIKRASLLQRGIKNILDRIVRRLSNR